MPDYERDTYDRWRWELGLTKPDEDDDSEAEVEPSDAEEIRSDDTGPDAGPDEADDDDENFNDSDAGGPEDAEFLTESDKDQSTAWLWRSWTRGWPCWSQWYEGESRAGYDGPDLDKFDAGEASAPYEDLSHFRDFPDDAYELSHKPGPELPQTNLDPSQLLRGLIGTNKIHGRIIFWQ
jgi:hypothetical protein